MLFKTLVLGLYAKRRTEDPVKRFTRLQAVGFQLQSEYFLLDPEF